MQIGNARRGLLNHTKAPFHPIRLQEPPQGTKFASCLFSFFNVQFSALEINCRLVVEFFCHVCLAKFSCNARKLAAGTNLISLKGDAGFQHTKYYVVFLSKCSVLHVFQQCYLTLLKS